MKLKELLRDNKVLRYNKVLDDVEVLDIKIDSRKVKNGDMFIALKGVRDDGNNYIKNAISNGAKIVVGESECDVENYLQVEDARKFYALASKNFFNRACDKMKIIGVTGTNGKTTTTNIIFQILQKTSKKTGIIGTFGAKWDKNDKFLETNMTTPDPYMLHKLFYQMFKYGCEYVVMEVSAHAIALHKIDGIKFEVGVLTNITQDHLDFFKTMSNYALTKIKFLDEYVSGDKYVCFEDKYCKGYIKNTKSNIITYGFGECDIWAKNIKQNIDGVSFDLKLCNENLQVESKLVGIYNILNLMIAISVCKYLGIESKQILDAIKDLENIPGRFNVLKYGSSRVIIDYAHTPDGLEKILKAIRELSEDKLVIVFGCGGDRDNKKRSIMGRVASDNADIVILTSDNPRSEDPEQIIKDISLGCTKSFLSFINRKDAIDYALNNFRENSNIVIAGKGAEEYQEIKGTKHHFCDYEIVDNFIKNDKKSKKNNKN